MLQLTAGMVLVQILRPFLLATGLLSAACTTHIDDLEFAGLESVSQSMLPPFEHTWIPSDGKVLRVRFRSQVNLSELDGNDYMYFSLCPYRDDPFVDLSQIYSGGYEIWLYRYAPGYWLDQEWLKGNLTAKQHRYGLGSIEPSGGYYYYEGYFEYKNLSHFDDNLHTVVYSPLPATVQDLCFRIWGASILWFDYDSNVVRIPADVLSSALASSDNSLQPVN
jgi:hypothetical protein